MNAAAILKSKGNTVVTLRPGATLEDAARLMAERHIGCVLVLARDASLAGILSERDIVREVALGGAGSLGADVTRAMTRQIHTCQLHDTVDHLMALMTAHRFRHVPVVADGELVGIVSIGDVVKFKIAEAEMETEAMRSYIANAG